MKITRILLLTLLFVCCLPLPGCVSAPRINNNTWQAPPIKFTPPAVVPAYSSGSMNFVPMREKTLIVIDPGHGGKDLGTHSAKAPKYQEKQMTLVTARFLKQDLEKMGYAVQMTRNEDVYIALDKRAEFANARKPALFVSIHYNSAPNKEAQGIEIFYYRSERSSADKKRTNDSKTLGKAILKRMLLASEAKSRGVKHGDLAVIRETNMPAVLIEGGFATNGEEVKKLKNVDYLKKLALAMAEGIHDYAKTLKG